MIPTSVYLAGPMSGRTMDQMGVWRQQVAEYFAKTNPGVTVLSPLRGKLHALKASTEASGGSLQEHTLQNPLSTAQAVVQRDHHDVQVAEVILVNFLGAERVSIGTVAEVAWAYHLHKPVIAIIEPEGNPHEHPFITEAFTHRTEDLATAIRCAALLLNVEQ